MSGLELVKLKIKTTLLILSLGVAILLPYIIFNRWKILLILGLAVIIVSPFAAIPLTLRLWRRRSKP